MKRYSFYLDEDVIQKVKEMADKDKRSLSYMVSVLLQQAVKEKLRKQKIASKKEDHS